MDAAQEKDPERPNPERPMLVGLLVDVSGSMSQAINADRNETLKKRIDVFKDSFEQLVEHAIELSQRGIGTRIAPIIRLFAYG